MQSPGSRTSFPRRYCPNDVNRAPIGFMLERQNSWATDSIPIILQRDSGCNSNEDFTGDNTILLQFLKSMIGNEEVSARHERLYPTQGLAHVQAESIITQPLRSWRGVCRCGGGQAAGGDIGPCSSEGSRRLPPAYRWRRHGRRRRRLPGRDRRSNRRF